MLQAIEIVTLCVPDLAAAERAYTDWVGYELLYEGAVGDALAAAWGAPLAAGSGTALLRASASPDFHLRLIERPPTPGYTVLRSHGWNANEILAQDPEVLAARFAQPESPFRVIGAPEPLASNPAIVAMQALGPAGELNYFTRLPPGGGTFIKTPARGFVDRSFILVVGGPSMAGMQAFYRDVMGLAVTPAYESPVGVLQAAHGLSSDETTGIALAPISPSFALELDRYPPGAIARPQRPGDLPPGLAMVSFRAEALPALPWVQRPAVRPETPYDGRIAGLLCGAAGEWLEIIAAR